jgi:hypothetical protein
MARVIGRVTPKLHLGILTVQKIHAVASNRVVREQGPRSDRGSYLSGWTVVFNAIFENDVCEIDFAWDNS